MTALSTDRLDRRGALRRLLPVLRGHRLGIALTLLVAGGAQATGIGAAALAADLTGRAATGHTAGALTTHLWVLGVLVVSRAVFGWAESWVAHRLAFEVMADLRAQLFEGIARLAPGWLFQRRSGDVASTALADVEALEWFYAHTVAQVAVTVLVPFGALVALARIHPRLGLVLLPFVIALAVVPLVLLRRGDREGRAIRHGLGHLQAEVADTVQGIRELVLHRAGDRWRDRLADHTRRLGTLQRSNASRTGLENAATEGLLVAAMLAVLLAGALLVEADELSAARYPTAVVIAGLALTPVTILTGGVRNLGLLRATASRVSAVVDTPTRTTDPDPDRALPETTAIASPPSVVFEDVTFGYDPAHPVLRGVDFEVPGGTTLALVGTSGAGKSTCANLLLRFWDPDRGRVRLGDVDIRDLPLARLRRTVCLVPQEPYLFSGSLADNLRLAAPSASAAELADAADRALVTPFASRLPEGLDTPVAERGASLSGGQRQRVALAQALLRDAEVLVLDEAVAGLDARGELLLRRAMARARHGRTTIVIAHRLSTIMAADEVVVLEDGRVAQQGTPAALLERPGPFQRLVAGQLRDA